MPTTEPAPDDEATTRPKPRRTARTVGACLAAALLLAVPPSPLAAQGLDGQYRLRIDGTSQRLDGEADAEEFAGVAVLRASDSDGWIAFEIDAQDAPLPGGRFEGRADGRTFAATWQEGGADESAIVRGQLADGQMFKATLIWTADGAARLVEATLVGRRTGPARQAVAPHGPEEPGQAAARVLDAVRRADPGRVRMPDDPGARRPFPAADPEAGEGDEEGDEAGGFDADLTVVFVPEAPTSAEQVSVLVRADARRPDQEVERIDVRLEVDGRLQVLSGRGNTLDRPLPGLDAGRYEVRVEAVGPGGATSPTVRRTLTVRSAGSAVVRGRISGSTGAVTGVEIVDARGRTVATTDLGPDGRYRLDGLPAGEYVLAVLHRGGRIEPTSRLEIAVDGRSTYERDFTVR